MIPSSVAASRIVHGGTLMLRLSLCALIIAAPALSAQDGVWTHDYNAARQRAATEKKPIIIDFGTENCFWCKKLDATTFRDPVVMRRLAQQFIAVRIDADKEPALAKHLGISSYPTLVFAASDGRILGQHAGYVEIPRFNQQLDRAIKENDSAAKAVAAAPTKQPAAAPVSMAATERTAHPLLMQIRDDYAANRLVSCLERCKELTAIEPASTDAAEAQRIARDIKSDPAKIRIVEAALVEALGDVYLANAETAIRERRFQDAKTLLERTQELCPGSAQALAAKTQDMRLRAQLTEQQPIFRMQAP